eukprot:7333883-Prymnesium_polylepis.1
MTGRFICLDWFSWCSGGTERCSHTRSTRFTIFAFPRPGRLSARFPHESRKPKRLQTSVA